MNLSISSFLEHNHGIVMASVAVLIILSWSFLALQLYTENANSYQSSTTLSNIGAIPGLLFLTEQILFKRQLSFVLEFFVLGAAMTASTVYHLQDQKTISAFEYETLQHADFVASNSLIVLLPFTISRPHWGKTINKKTLVLDTARVFGFFLLFPFVYRIMRPVTRFTSSAFTTIIILTMFGALFAAFSIFLRLRKHSNEENSNNMELFSGIVVSLPSAYVATDILLKGIGIVSFIFLSDHEEYELVHSYGWHLPAFLSFYFTFLWTTRLNQLIYEEKRENLEEFKRKMLESLPSETSATLA